VDGTCIVWSRNNANSFLVGETEGIKMLGNSRNRYEKNVEMRSYRNRIGEWGQDSSSSGQGQLLLGSEEGISSMYIRGTRNSFRIPFPASKYVI
jgi:hypothetical protein